MGAPWCCTCPDAQIETARGLAGDYAVIAAQTPDDIVGFAREFSKRHWLKTGDRNPARKA